MRYVLRNLENDYELELGRITEEILRSQVAGRRSQEFRVLLQLPDGLKPWGLVICDYLSEKCRVDVSIWMGACFGACDLPDADADLVVQFGHARWA